MNDKACIYVEDFINTEKKKKIKPKIICNLYKIWKVEGLGLALVLQNTSLARIHVEERNFSILEKIYIEIGVHEGLRSTLVLLILILNGKANVHVDERNPWILKK